MAALPKIMYGNSKVLTVKIRNKSTGITQEIFDIKNKNGVALYHKHQGEIGPSPNGCFTKEHEYDDTEYYTCYGTRQYHTWSDYHDCGGTLRPTGSKENIAGTSWVKYIYARCNKCGNEEKNSVWGYDDNYSGVCHAQIESTHSNYTCDKCGDAQDNSGTCYRTLSRTVKKKEYILNCGFNAE